MPAWTDCPDEGTLRAYIDRQLPAAEQVETAQHLAACPGCAAALAALHAQAAQVYAALDRVAVPQPSANAAYQRFTSRHPALGRRSVAAAPSPTSRFSFGAARSASYISRVLSWRLQTMFQNRAFRWQPALIGVVVFALLLSVFTVAPLRAAAGQFLDIFRVRKLAVVQVNTGQLERLESFQGQIFAEPQVDKAPSVNVNSAAEASQAAGFQVLAPEFVPGSLGAPKEFVVEPGGHAQTTVDLKAARSLLQMANLPTDAIPADRDSIDVSAELKPTVGMHYSSADGQSLVIVQGMSPDVNVPPGVDLAKIGEVGLQLLGMSPEAANRFSQSVDWATTLVLPVPKDMASVQEIQVRGTTGYFLEGTGRTSGTGGTPSALIWQEKGLLYMVEGDYGQPVLVRVAESLQ